MKFDLLFNQVFLTEADNINMLSEDDRSSVATADTDIPEVDPTHSDVEGVPTPDNYGVEDAPVITPAGNAETLLNYAEKIEQFIKELNDPSEGSLNKLITDLDYKGSLFDGITRTLSADIINAAKQLSEISQALNGFAINSKKRAKDLAINQGQ